MIIAAIASLISSAPKATLKPRLVDQAPEPARSHRRASSPERRSRRLAVPLQQSHPPDLLQPQTRRLEWQRLQSRLGRLTAQQAVRSSRNHLCTEAAGSAEGRIVGSVQASVK